MNECKHHLIMARVSFNIKMNDNVGGAVEKRDPCGL